MPKHHKPTQVAPGALASLEAAGQEPRTDRPLVPERDIAEDYAATAAARHRPRPLPERRPFENLKKGR